MPALSISHCHLFPPSILSFHPSSISPLYTSHHTSMLSLCLSHLYCSSVLSYYPTSMLTPSTSHCTSISPHFSISHLHMYVHTVIQLYPSFMSPHPHFTTIPLCHHFLCLTLEHVSINVPTALSPNPTSMPSLPPSCLDSHTGLYHLLIPSTSHHVQQM